MSHGGSPSAPTPLPSPRVIPAYAGNAPSCATRARGSPVHPPMRGERLPCPDQAWPHLGSSPHARGTLLGKNPQRAIERFIPACAGNAPWVRTSGWPRTVHPRMRGERRVSAESIMASIGSSPHTRGTPAADDPMTALVRFIPAYAGNARSAIPRHGAVCGSSPHTRGTLGGKLDALRHVRFIPAYAGNALALHAGTSSPAVHPRIRGERPVETGGADVAVGSSPHTRGTLFRGGWHRLCSTVHPRIRGERLYCARAAAIRDGSSPHTRGTPLGSHCWRSNPRFIPAYAGNAKSLAPHSSPHSVHPRIRGERARSIISRYAATGSSPHTRGTHDIGKDSDQRQRFIPAYAGNAAPTNALHHGVSVHPRIRGERRVNSNGPGDHCGSSPHTRGTLLACLAGRPVVRFSPAYAGNAHRRTPARRAIPVHPRIRGERCLLTEQFTQTNGSSPHTRGTPYKRDTRTLSDRFIPAYAGNASTAGMPQPWQAVHPRIRGER